MAVRVKFCGLTRPEDLAVAESLGAEYVGAVFAGGPRRQSSESAAALFATLRANDHVARRVGVVSLLDPAELATLADAVPLDILQLHADPTPDAVRAARELTGREVWAVVRITGNVVPSIVNELFLASNAVVLDTRSSSGLGGTGTTFDWSAVAEQIASYRGKTRVIVAGGLTPANVAEAVRILRPDVVDVSSGVESAPGIKDHRLMHQFAEAARAADTRSV